MGCFQGRVGDVAERVNRVRRVTDSVEKGEQFFAVSIVRVFLLTFPCCGLRWIGVPWGLLGFHH
jgi:hypothetical protein